MKGVIMGFQERLEQIRKARKDTDCEFTTTNYIKFRKTQRKSLPSLSYIYQRMTWPELIKLLDGKKAKFKKDATIIRTQFCRDCVNFEDCKLHLNECEYYQNRKDYKLYQESWFNNA